MSTRSVTSRAQALVEMTLVLVIFLPLGLAAAEAGFLFATKLHQDRATASLAHWAAEHPGESWKALAAHLLPGCDVTIVAPFPDTLEATATCLYTPMITSNWWDGLPISSTEAG